MPTVRVQLPRKPTPKERLIDRAQVLLDAAEELSGYAHGDMGLAETLELVYAAAATMTEKDWSG